MTAGAATAGSAAPYAVVLVNWNGADDTLACLASLRAGARPALTVVVDNGSTDGSLARIAGALAAAGAPPAVLTSTVRPRAAPPIAPGTRGTLLVDAGENLGFAAGCNLGLRVVDAACIGTVVFLNNDTVVEVGALEAIVQRLHDDAGCFATLPMLTVHGSDTVWNCGGTVSWLGYRRYHLQGRPRAEAAAHAALRCSFFTGCCFAVRTAAFVARGGFSERFFFGEEDFELALWMRARGLTALCLPSAVVQHKVSAAFSAAAGPRQNAKVTLYYLNRFIHMRLRLGRARWVVWLALYLPYVAWLVWRGGLVPPAALPRWILRLVARAGAMDGVTRSDFEAVMAGRL